VLLHCAESTAKLLDHAAEAPRRRPQVRSEQLTTGIGAQILRDLNVRRMRLLAAPRKFSLAAWELSISGFLEPEKSS